jgi:hypothetical protein
MCSHQGPSSLNKISRAENCVTFWSALAMAITALRRV